jgi:hypothetical protein
MLSAGVMRVISVAEWKPSRVIVSPEKAEAEMPTF